MTAAMEKEPAGAAPPGILIIQHHKENRKKCTVTAIEGRPGIEVRVLRPGPSGYRPVEIEGGILLAVGAAALSPRDRALLDGPGKRLVLIDANWVKVPGIIRALEPAGPLARRSLDPAFRTAYPRRSKVFQDPPGGLATVEAIAAAMAVLGFFDPAVLSGYVWAEKFLELNRGLFDGPSRPLGHFFPSNDPRP